MTVWRGVGVRSWPSLAVVGPKGNLLLMVSGEGNKEVIDACITAALGFYAPETFRHEPLPMTPEVDKTETTTERPLLYPGKIAADASTGRLYISDSNHNRIVVTDLEGNFVESIGSGRVGLDDGDYAEATFFRLQGLAVDGDVLWVADAENHALRRVDLKAKRVSTVAGGGTQGRDYSGGKAGREQLLSTPWDVAVSGDRVFIAMAGTHQIWVHEKSSGLTRVFSGSGREQNLNSENPLEAAWAQPSGLTIGDGWLFVADSESSSVRGVHLESGHTKTFVGGDDNEPRDLFAFGDVDGVGDAARLQHCLGVQWLEAEGRVLVADTYNHRLKLVDHEKRSVVAFSGSGEAGAADGAGVGVGIADETATGSDPSKGRAQYFEPSGFALHPDGKRVFVADTNNHQVRLLDRANGAVTTLTLRGVPPAKTPHAPRTQRLADLPGATRMRAEPLQLDAEGRGSVRLRVTLPKDHHYTTGAESRWQVFASSGESRHWTVPERQAAGNLTRDVEEFVVSVTADQLPSAKAAPSASEKSPVDSSNVNFEPLTIEVLGYYCKKDGACLVGAMVVEVPIVRGSESSQANTSEADSSVADAAIRTIEYTFPVSMSPQLLVPGGAPTLNLPPAE